MGTLCRRVSMNKRPGLCPAPHAVAVCAAASLTCPLSSPLRLTLSAWASLITDLTCVSARSSTDPRDAPAPAAG